MHRINGGLTLADGLLHSGLERCLYKLKGQGHWPRGVEHKVDLTVGLSLKQVLNVGHVTERGAHEEELRVGEREQRDLPGPAAVMVGKVMELVHGNASDARLLTPAQGVTSKDLGRAADDGRVSIDDHVACDHPHVLATQHVHQLKELLAYQRFDGRRVVRALARGQRHEAHAQRHHALSRARWGAQHHVVSHRKVHEGILLVIPELKTTCEAPLEIAFERLVCG